MNEETEAVVSVAEMARRVFLSRNRFYQLMGTAFPYPLYDIRTRRPFYPEDLQEVCLDVRRRNCGVDGRPVLFYTKGHRPAVKKKRVTASPSSKKTNRFDWIIDGLSALGLGTVAHDQVVAAVNATHPNGTSNVDQQDVLRAVFLQIKRQDSGDNVGR